MPSLPMRNAAPRTTSKRCACCWSQTRRVTEPLRLLLSRRRRLAAVWINDPRAVQQVWVNAKAWCGVLRDLLCAVCLPSSSECQHFRYWHLNRLAEVLDLQRCVELGWLDGELWPKRVVVRVTVGSQRFRAHELLSVPRLGTVPACIAQRRRGQALSLRGHCACFAASEVGWLGFVFDNPAPQSVKRL